MSLETPAAAPLTYRLPLGEEWRRIRLDENADDDVKALLDVSFSGIPDEAGETVRTALAQRFGMQVAAARAKSGLDLYLPADPVHAAASGAGAAAAILVAQVVIPAAVAPDPVDVVARVAAANPAARTGIIAGTPTVRIDHGAAVTPDGDDESESPRTRHVEYVMAVPNDPAHRWLSIALTGQGGSDEDVAEFDRAVAELEF